jgi:hypothetical protein
MEMRKSKSTGKRRGLQTSPRALTLGPEALTPSRVRLNEACVATVMELRRREMTTLPRSPVPVGEVAPDIAVPAPQARGLYQIAFADASGATSAKSEQIVWVNGEHELLVNAKSVRVEFVDGFVLVGIPVFSEQTGAADVVVAFAVGRPGAPQGLVMATETLPRGPALVVERWGEALTAAAWAALILVARGVAGAAGTDETNEPLLPAALTAAVSGIRVTPQATHGFDRVKQ